MLQRGLLIPYKNLQILKWWHTSVSKERTWSSAGSRISLTLPDLPTPFVVHTQRLIKEEEWSRKDLAQLPNSTPVNTPVTVRVVLEVLSVWTEPATSNNLSSAKKGEKYGKDVFQFLHMVPN